MALSVLILSMSSENKRTVYSTERDIHKEDRPSEAPESAGLRKMSVPVELQRVLVRLEKKGRGGKSVTLIEGHQMTSQSKESLLKQLKTRLGTGGAVKDDVIEIQGDHRDAITTTLEGLGYRPKRAGG